MELTLTSTSEDLKTDASCRHSLSGISREWDAASRVSSPKDDPLYTAAILPTVSNLRHSENQFVSPNCLDPSTFSCARYRLVANTAGDSIEQQPCQKFGSYLIPSVEIGSDKKELSNHQLNEQASGKPPDIGDASKSEPSQTIPTADIKSTSYVPADEEIGEIDAATDASVEGVGFTNVNHDRTKNVEVSNSDGFEVTKDNDTDDQVINRVEVLHSCENKRVNSGSVAESDSVSTDCPVEISARPEIRGTHLPTHSCKISRLQRRKNKKLLLMSQAAQKHSESKSVVEKSTTVTAEQDILGVDLPQPATTVVTAPFTLNLKTRISRPSTLAPTEPEILGVDLPQPATAVITAPFTLNLKTRISRPSQLATDEPEILGVDCPAPASAVVTTRPFTLNLKTRISSSTSLPRDEPITLENECFGVEQTYYREGGSTKSDSNAGSPDVITVPDIVQIESPKPFGLNLKPTLPRFSDEPRPPGTTSDDEDDYLSVFKLRRPHNAAASDESSALLERSLSLENPPPASTQEATADSPSPIELSPVATPLVKREISSDDEDDRPRKRIYLVGDDTVHFRTKLDAPLGGYCELCQVRYLGRLFDHRISIQHRTNRAVSRPFCSECSRNFDSAAAYWHHCVLVHERAATIQVEVDEFEHLWQSEPRVAEQQEEAEETCREVETDIDMRFFVDDDRDSEESEDDDSVREVYSDEENEPFVYPSANPSPAAAPPPGDAVHTPAFYCNACKIFFEADGGAADRHRLSDEHVQLLVADGRRANGLRMSWDDDAPASGDEEAVDDDAAGEFDERFFVDLAHGVESARDRDEDGSDDGDNDVSDRNDCIVIAHHCKRCFNFFHETVEHTCEIELI